jgi:hypothetical protein
VSRPDPSPLSDATPREYLEVVEAITALFIAIDAKDWEAARACLADRVNFDLSSVTGSPPQSVSTDTIIEGWKHELEPIQAVHHQVGNFRVTASVREADAFCYGIVYHYRPNVSGQNTRVLVASYNVHLVREPVGRWVIDRFRVNAKFADGNLELEKC